MLLFLIRLMIILLLFFGFDPAQNPMLKTLGFITT
jgi:hypothetical protein